MVNCVSQVPLINSLLKHCVYPHQVVDIQLIETHISWVILTGNYVYKIKKPVNFGFLDFSTLAHRKHYCHKELQLNKRFAPALYLAVVAITGSETQPEIEGKGEIIEFAVKMRQFEQSALFCECARRGEISSATIESLARTLVNVHRQAFVADGDQTSVADGQNQTSITDRPGQALVADSQNQTSITKKQTGLLVNAETEGDKLTDYGSLRWVARDARENFRANHALLDYSAGSRLAYLYQWTVAQLEVLTTAIAQRKQTGFIRQCHGDLHLGNIAVINGQITLFDCIEFNDGLRFIDPFSELAFLLMDFHKQSHGAWANRLLNKYLEYSGDFDGMQLLVFYQVYRAMVRVKVNALRLEQQGLSQQAQKKILADYYSYIALAERYTVKKTPFLSIMHGVSGTGKSTLSMTIAEHFDAVCVRSDIERKRLSGLSALQKTESGVGQGIYSETATKQTFSRLYTIAGQLLDYGFNVIVDATFLAKDKRYMFKALADSRKVPFVIIDCQVSEQNLVKRLQTRSNLANDASEADIHVMQNQRLSQSPLSEKERCYTFVVDTEKAFLPEKLSTFIARL